jgi:excisionase family DNA binding protein
MVSKGADVDRQTVNLDTVAKVLGVSRPVVYDLARKDQLPVPVLRIGRRMVVSKRALEALLDAQKGAAGNEAA